MKHNLKLMITTSLATTLLLSNQIVNAQENVEEPIIKTDIHTENTTINENDIDNQKLTIQNQHHQLEKTAETIKHTNEKIETIQENIHTIENKLNNTPAVSNNELNEVSNHIQQQENTINQKENELTKIDDQINTLTNQEHTKQQEIKTIQQDINTEKEKLESLETNLNDAALRVIKNKQAEVDAAQEDVDLARDELKNAKIHDDNLIKEQDNALETVKIKQADVIKAEDNEKHTKQQLDSLKLTIENVEVLDYNGFPVDVKLSDEYIIAFKNWMTFSDTENNESSRQLKETNPDEFNRQKEALRAKIQEAETKVLSSPQNQEFAISHARKYSFGDERYNKILANVMQKSTKRLWQDNINDVDNEPLYDAKNLPKELVEELNLYGLALLNSIRQQFKLPELTININAMAMAEDIANEVEKAEFKDMAHHIPSITKAAKKHGLDDENNYYENLLTTQNPRYATKDELYAHVHSAIVGFFYEGFTSQTNRQYPHARSLYRKKYGIGFGFSYIERPERKTGVFKIHLVGPQDYTAEPEVLTEKWGSKPEVTLQPKQKEKDQLTKQLESALKQHQNATKKLVDATKQLNLAKDTYKQLIQQKLKVPKAIERLSKAQALLDLKTNELEELLDTYNRPTTTNNEASTTIDDLKENIQAKEQQLNVQKAALLKIQAQLYNAKQQKKTIQHDIENAKNQLNKLKTKHEKMTELANVRHNLEQQLMQKQKELKLTNDALLNAKELFKKQNTLLSKEELKLKQLKEKYQLQLEKNTPVIHIESTNANEDPIVKINQPTLNPDTITTEKVEAKTESTNNVKDTNNDQNIKIEKPIVKNDQPASNSNTTTNEKVETKPKSTNKTTTTDNDQKIKLEDPIIEIDQPVSDSNTTTTEKVKTKPKSSDKPTTNNDKQTSKSEESNDKTDQVIHTPNNTETKKDKVKTKNDNVETDNVTTIVEKEDQNISTKQEVPTTNNPQLPNTGEFAISTIVQQIGLFVSGLALFKRKK